MTRTRVFAAFIAVALILAARPVRVAAEESAATAPAPVKEEPATKPSENPFRAKVEKRTKEIGEKRKPEELEHLFYIREGFGILRAVYMVERDVGTAVKACGRANPALREGMDKRFGDWTHAVDPVMKEKQDMIDAAVNGQTYVKPKEIKDYLKLIEQAADYANRTTDKRIVTTEDACNKLSASMDRTQDTVVKLLGQISVKPWPPVADTADEDKTGATPN